MRILITSLHNPLNKGEAAILQGMIEALTKVIPEANFTVLSLYPRIDPIQHVAQVVETIPPSLQTFMGKIKAFPLMFQRVLWTVIYTIFRVNIERILDPRIRRTLKAYSETDIIVSRGNDCFTDAHGMVSYLTHLYDLFLVTLMEKPVVIYAHTIGPFRNTLLGRFCKFLTKIALNRSCLITVREETSKELLQKMKINTPIYLTADSAFVLRPAPKGRIKKILSSESIKNELGRPLVGIVVSAIYSYGFYPEAEDVNEKRKMYIKLMAEVADYLVCKWNALIILLTHVADTADYIISKDIRRMIKEKKNAKLITADKYTCQELKGIIGELDLLVSSRMHPVIHAISMHVPAVAIDYTYKAKALMKAIDRENQVLDLRALNFDNLISKIDDVMRYRDKIKKEMMSQARIMRRLSLRNAELIRNLMVQGGNL